MRALSLLVFAIASLEVVHSAPRSANNGSSAPRRRGTAGCPPKSNPPKQQQLLSEQPQPQSQPQVPQGQQQEPKQQQPQSQEQEPKGQQQQQQPSQQEEPKGQQQPQSQQQQPQSQQPEPQNQQEPQQRPEEKPQQEPQEKPLEKPQEKPKIPPRPTGEKLPNTVVLDAQRMLETRWLVKHGEYPDQLSYVAGEANAWYGRPALSVYSKKREAPNGVPGDYASQAPFWWPSNWENRNEGEACPYIRRDGERNPEIDEYDRVAAANMMYSSYYLTLAWWYVPNEEARPLYRKKAGTVLRTWFLDEKTRMNPHLNHAQFIPCAEDGRSYGVIDFAQQYTDVIEAVALLNTVFDEHWSKEDADAFAAWNREFLTWLTESDFGQEALWAPTSRGNYAIMQVAAIAAFLGEKEMAAEYLRMVIPRIDAEIQGDGQQPAEMGRTRPWHFSTANLVAFFRMDAIGQLAGIDVDLWGHVGPQGQSLQAAIEFLMPYAPYHTEGVKVWPYDEVRTRISAHNLIRYAADRGLESAVSYLEGIGMVDWNLVPACAQFDMMIWS